MGIPPWVILGAIFILAPIFLYMTFETINRQKINTEKLLIEKGAALIRSFEAGARTGIMAPQWGGHQVQSLLQETAKQTDIMYIMVINRRGDILAHNDVTQIGNKYGLDLDLEHVSMSKNIRRRKVSRENGERVFEVFRQFSPIRGRLRNPPRRIMRNDWFWPHLNPDRALRHEKQIIFVGLDMGSIETARRVDARHTVIMAAVLLLIGFAGIVSLFLAHAYRSTRATLSRVKAFSDSLVENMPIGLVAIDSKGEVASFNHTAASILQLPSRQDLWKNPRQSLPEPFWELIDQLKAGKRHIEKDIQCPVYGGKIVPLEVIATFFQEEKGGFGGHVILFRDLSEIQQLKNEVATNRRLAAVGRLAAGVAHEIRNPLSSIKGFATYFKERYREIPEDQKTADIMIQEVERLNRVIGQLLEYARPVSLQKVPTSLQDLIQHCLKLIEKDAQRNTIQVKENISSDIGEVMLDPDRMQQVLLNLFLNAIESMENGGTLSVGLERNHTNQQIQIILSDTGKGIREEDLTQVFDPYFTTKPSGTGLGLAIVYKIIESHGADVRIQSYLGTGTTVTILFPLSLEA